MTKWEYKPNLLALSLIALVWAFTTVHEAEYMARNEIRQGILYVCWVWLLKPLLLMRITEGIVKLIIKIKYE